MAQLQNAYSDAYTHYIQGLNDPVIQQWQHAFAQPQSGTNGSGDPASILGLNLGGGNPLQNGSGGIFVQPIILSNTGTGGTGGTDIIIPPPPPYQRPRRYCSLRVSVTRTVVTRSRA
jgi:hypothetical protein